MTKLALGTAQFGMAYGVANQTGKVNLGELERILQLAREARIDTIDTAINYGDSEARLGAIGVSDFKIITKLPPIPAGVEDVDRWVSDHLETSRARLGIKVIEAVLCHRAADWFGEHANDLHGAFARAKAAGTVRLTGVSIYGPELLEEISKRARPDIVQAPLNLLDRRLSDSHWLDRLNEAGVQVHARSVFLQGLLLMRKNFPKKFAPWRQALEQLDAWFASENVSPLSGCLRSVCGMPGVERVVVGVDSSVQFSQILAAAGPALHPPSVPISDTRILDPSIWNQI